MIDCRCPCTRAHSQRTPYTHTTTRGQVSTPPHSSCHHTVALIVAQTTRHSLETIPLKQISAHVPHTHSLTPLTHSLTWIGYLRSL